VRTEEGTHIFSSAVNTGIRKRWARTAIIILALALPLSVYGTAGPLYSSFQDRIQSYANFSGGYIAIWPKQTPFFSVSQLEPLRQVPHVTEVYGVLEAGIGLPLRGALAQAQKSCGNPLAGSPNASNIDLNLDIIAFNMTAAAHLLIPYQLVSGRLPFPNETAIAVNQVSAPCFAIGLGSSVTGSDADYYAPQLNASGMPTGPPSNHPPLNVTLPTVGVYSTVQLAGNAGDAIMDLTTARVLFPDLKGLYSDAWITVDNVQNVPAVAQALQKMLPGFNVAYPGTFVQLTTSLLSAASNTTLIIVASSVVVSVGTILAVKGIDAQGRKREIGLLQTFGWTNPQILQYEISSSFIQGLVAGLMASVFAMLLGPTIAESAGLRDLAVSFGISGSFDFLWYSTIILLSVGAAMVSSVAVISRLLRRAPSGLIRS
jgi:ABC-type antimicrobial peptide transport system permease subunit